MIHSFVRSYQTLGTFRSTQSSSGTEPQFTEETVMTFVVAGVVLLLALLVGTVFDEDEPGEDDLAAYAGSSSDGLASWRSSISNPFLDHR